MPSIIKFQQPLVGLGKGQKRNSGKKASYLPCLKLGKIINILVIGLKKITRMQENRHFNVIKTTSLPMWIWENNDPIPNLDIDYWIEKCYIISQCNRILN